MVRGLVGFGGLRFGFRAYNVWGTLALESQGLGFEVFKNSLVPICDNVLISPNIEPY